MQLQKITLTAVYINTTNKDGSPLMTNTGKPYSKMNLKAKEYGDRYISGFANQSNEKWKAGDVVEVIIEQKGEYLNFKNPTPEQLLEIRVAKLEENIIALSTRIAVLEKPKVGLAGLGAFTPSAPQQQNLGQNLVYTGKTPSTDPTMEDINNEYLNSGEVLDEEIPY